MKLSIIGKKDLRYPCSSSRTITASACSRDSVVVWIIFLRLAGPFPVHASTSFRGVSFSSMDAASSKICTTSLACWVMSTVAKSGRGRSQKIIHSNLEEEYFALTHTSVNFIKPYHIHIHTPSALRQVSHIWLHPSSSHTSSKCIAMRERRHLHTANMRLRHSSHSVQTIIYYTMCV